MLKSITIKNYRCFEEHRIEFRDLTIAVGKNNAGKSTFIETIRLLSLVTSRFKSLSYNECPSWLELPKLYKGVSPSIEGIEISTSNIFHQYGDAPSCISAEFTNGVKIELYVGEEARLYAIIYDAAGNMIKNKGEARGLEVPEINILPQVAPLRVKEIILNDDYVLKNINSANSSLHFRNQLHYLPQFYQAFKENAEETWSSLRIRSLDVSGDIKNRELDLFVQDNYFVAEVGWMGHGLQMWLQTIWFLTRCSKSSTVILDEPDVYMHADLQRKLIRYLRTRFPQVIVATHSIEIMSEVDPENILLIDKAKSQSKYTTSMPVVQRIVNSIGSIHNIQLARLWSSKKLLIVEGKDIEILKRIQNTLLGNSLESFESIPNFSIGGWGGWNYAVGSKLLLKNAGDKSLMAYCLFDSDYHTEEEKNKRLEEAQDFGIELHIWRKKEIENYLLVPTAISRIINSSKKKGGVLNSDLVLKKMLGIAEDMKDEITDAIASEIQMKNKGIMAGTAHKSARERVSNSWGNKLGFVSGKQLITKLSEWAQAEYGVSFSSNRIATTVTKEEIDSELAGIVLKICNSKPL